MNTYPVNPDTLDEMIRTLQFVLDEPQLFTASGRTPKNPATSMARLPELEMTSRTGGGRASAPPDNMLRNPTYESTRMKDVAANMQRAKIDEILSKIDLNLPAPQAAPAPGRMPGLQPLAEIAGKMAPVLTLLDLLTQTTELNKGEDAELAARRRMPPSN
jgi:hypothetical protein